MKINIFKDKKLEIELPKFVDSRALICANSGGGKSYAVRKILEESSEKVMSIILDVEGEFRTLREQYDFLLIGSEGDVELNMKSAKLIPQKIMDLEISTIIDISDLKRTERIKYVKDFLEALMELPRKKENGESYWKPCLVILDEAHLLAGQQEKQDSCSSVIDLMTRGRKRGYCGVLCTQRISKLHKDAVAEANNIMIGRTGLDIDMKRASEILGFTNKQDMLSLRDLDEGEFFVFGTAISKHVTKAKVSEVKTTHPKVGMDLRKEIIKPTNKVIKILSKLKDLPQEAEKELRELNDYKNKVMELKRQIRILEHSKPKPEIDEKALERARQQGIMLYEKENKNNINEMIKNFTRKEKTLFSRINEDEIKFNQIRKILGEETKEITKTEYSIKPKTLIKQSPIKTNFNVPVTQVTPQVKHSVTTISDGEYNLNLCARKIYSFLYNHQERSFTKIQLAVMTGYSIRSSGFINALSQMNVSGLIKKNGDSIIVEKLEPSVATENMPEFKLNSILNQISKCPREIMEVLIENPYESFTRDEVAEKTKTEYSIKSSGFINAISKLNRMELIQKEGSYIKLNPELLELE